MHERSVEPVLLGEVAVRRGVATGTPDDRVTRAGERVETLRSSGSSFFSGTSTGSGPVRSTNSTSMPSRSRRAIAKSVSAGWGVAALAVAGSMVGALPLLAMLPIALLPRWWFGHRLPQRRVASARCPDCGYPGSTHPCPECGGDGTVARLELFARRPIAVQLLAAGILFALQRLDPEEPLRRD